MELNTHYNIDGDGGANKKESTSCFSNILCSRDSINVFPAPAGVVARKAVQPYEEDADAVAAREMNQLSLEERERVYEEIHGVSDAIDEEPHFVAQCLEQMEDEIRKIRKKTAYERALFLSPIYVQSRDFRLMFLRAERFDPQRSAKRFVKFFEYKLELFGMDKLVKTITLGDLDEDDMECLMTGSHYSLKDKDRAGRTIVFCSQRNENYRYFINMMRMCYYQYMVALEEDEDTQKKGIVNLVYSVGGVGTSITMKLDKEVFLNASKFMDCLPIRFVAMHYCFNDAKLRPVMSFIQLACGKHTRIRFRAHYGSNIECQYKLATFGISSEMLPLTHAGTFDTQEFYQYVDERRRIEAGSSIRISAGQIGFPSQFDVLLGRGRPYHEFTGNLRLSSVIDRYREAYAAGDRLKKTAISVKVVQIIKSMDGRFLKREEHGRGWVEVPEDVARVKISHSFRTKKRLNVPNSGAAAAAMEGFSSEDGGD